MKSISLFFIIVGMIAFILGAEALNLPAESTRFITYSAVGTASLLLGAVFAIIAT